MALIETYYGPNSPDDKSELFTADSFLNFIRRSNPVWHNDEHKKDEQQWIYRGHANADWKLIPTAGRPIQINILKNKIKSTLKELHKCKRSQFSQVHKDAFWMKKTAYEIAAYECYSEFIKKIRKMGEYSLPDPSPMRWCPYVSDQLREHEQEKLYFKNSQSIALAQHHQIPTFQLDWTFNSWNAAYFAINNSEETSLNKSICIWALNKQELPRIDERNLFTLDVIGIVEANPKFNSFLKSQEGILTQLISPSNIWRQTGDYPALEELYDPDHRKTNKIFLRKIVLNRQQVPELKELLKIEKITLSNIMPTFDNAAKETIDEISTPNPIHLQPYQRRRVSLASHSRSKSSRRRSSSQV